MSVQLYTMITLFTISQIPGKAARRGAVEAATAQTQTAAPTPVYGLRNHWGFVLPSSGQAEYLSPTRIQTETR